MLSYYMYSFLDTANGEGVNFYTSVTSFSTTEKSNLSFNKEWQAYFKHYKGKGRFLSRPLAIGPH